MSIAVDIHADRYLASIAGEPHVFHCHHYNCFLQKSIVDQAALFDVKRLLTDAAAEVVYSELSGIKAAGDTADVLFGQLGFGVLDAKALTAQGGTATVKGSHYALGWLSKFGKASEPVCYFVSGFIEASARQKFGTAFQVRETACVASGASTCTFEVKPGGRATLPPSVGMGTLAEFAPRPAFATQTSVDEKAIITACAGLPLAGTTEG